MEMSLENKMLQAIIAEDINAVTLLLSKGANPNKNVSNGKTCLGEAALRGLTEIAKKLIAESHSDYANKPLCEDQEEAGEKCPCLSSKKKNEVTLKYLNRRLNNLTFDTQYKAFLKGKKTSDSSNGDVNPSYYKIIHEDVGDEATCKNAMALTPMSPRELEWDEEIGNVAATTSEDESVTSMYKCPANELRCNKWIKIVCRQRKEEDWLHQSFKKWYATILENTGAAIAAASDFTCGIDQVDAYGKTAINYAADGNHPDIVKALAEAGCKLDVTGFDGWTPLHTSIAKNRVEVVKALLAGGSDVNFKTPIKTTALHIAAYHTLEMLTIIADHGATIDVRDEKERTPLYIAAAKGPAENVRFLISRGANVNIGDGDGHTPLCAAVGYRRHESVELLLNSGARITHYQCLLHTAIRHQKYELVKLLSNYGCGINVRNSITGETPLLLAMTLTDPYAYASILLQKGANVNTTNSNSGASALHVAVEYTEDPDDFENLLNLLLDYSIDLNRTASTRDTALNRAILMHKDRIAMQLIRYGANVNLCEVLINVYGNLIIASNRKGNKLANMLIKAGHNRVKMDTNENPTKTMIWITEVFKKPLSLIDLCRIQIRNVRVDKNDKRNLRDYVASLPVPDMIKGFLMMVELV